jgi:hypothetical protein
VTYAQNAQRWRACPPSKASSTSHLLFPRCCWPAISETEAGPRPRCANVKVNKPGLRGKYEHFRCW